MSGWLAPVAQAGGGIIDSLANVFGAKKREQRAFDRQKELIADERAYNDPSMQMERLKQAGINPAMAYAKGGLQNTVSSSGKSVAMAQAPRTEVGKTIGSSIMLAEQLRNLKADTAQKEGNANLLDEKGLAQGIENFVSQYMYQLDFGKGIPQLDINGERYSGKRAYEAWLKGEKNIPLGFQREFLNLTQQALNKQGTDIRNQINQAELNLKRLGYTFSDDMAVRVGISMAIEKGYNMDTIQGLTMAYGLISQVAPVFMKTGALKSLGRNTAKSVQPNKLSGKIKSQHKTISKSKSGRTTTSRTRNIYHD